MLDEKITIRANEVLVREGRVRKCSGITEVTSCENVSIKGHYGTLRLLRLRDRLSSNIIYKNVAIRLKNLPVAYIPYLNYLIHQ